MANLLLERLRETDKDGLFDQNCSFVTYPTGVPTLDYVLGYKLISRDDNENILATHDSLGVAGGSYVTIIGNSGTAKTALAYKMAGNIVKPFDNGFVIFFDIENAMNVTRCKTLTGFTNKEMKEKVIIKGGKTYIENISDTILDICNEKAKHKKDYLYTTDFKDEFGENITIYQPTVLVIDSIPQLCREPEKKTVKAKKGSGEEDYEIEDLSLGKNTYYMTVAKDLTEFYVKFIGKLKEYNITVIAVNHIRKNINMDVFAKPSEMLYLKQDERIPGGKASVYYASTLIKHTAIGKSKATLEEDGYSGFAVKAEIIKSRTNISGVTVPMVYDQNTGFSEERTLLYYAKEELGILNGGRKNSRYLGNRDDVRFNELDIVNEFKRPEVREVFEELVYPHLEEMIYSSDDIGELINKKDEGLTEDQMQRIFAD